MSTYATSTAERDVVWADQNIEISFSLSNVLQFDFGITRFWHVPWVGLHYCHLQRVQVSHKYISGERPAVALCAGLGGMMCYGIIDNKDEDAIKLALDAGCRIGGIVTGWEPIRTARGHIGRGRGTFRILSAELNGNAFKVSRFSLRDF